MEWKAAATVRIRDIGNIRIRYAVLCWPSDHAHSQAIKLLYSVYIKNIQIGNSAPELPLLAHSGMKCTQCTRHTHTSLTHTHVLIFLVYLYLFIVWPKSGPSISKTSRPLAVSLTHSPPIFYSSVCVPLLPPLAAWGRCCSESTRRRWNCAPKFPRNAYTHMHFDGYLPTSPVPVRVPLICLP